jgi:hypothetical protein
MLTSEQDKVVNDIIGKIGTRLKCHKPFEIDYKRFVYRVGGLAGTGKTFLLSELRRLLHSKYSTSFAAAFITFTGKASSVLAAKLKENNAEYGLDFVGTIHSFIYRPEFVYDKKLGKKVIVGWKRRPANELLDYNVIFIDEASMVSEKLWNDLMGYGISIVAVGDHGQLPPVGDNGFSLMGKANYYLQEIQRQAMESPIVKLAHYVRQGGKPKVNTMYGSNLFCLSWNDKQCQDMFYNSVENFSDDMIVLCGFNKSRVKINNLIRDTLGHSNPEPYPGEKIVCLKNNHDLGIMNGNTASVVWVYPFIQNTIKLTLELDGTGDFVDCCCGLKCFGKEKYDLYEQYGSKGSRRYKPLPSKFIKAGYRNIDHFDYGYCISVHKSQGSEWDKIILFNQNAHYIWDDSYYSKWLYTALTRAKTKVFIINDFF